MSGSPGLRLALLVTFGVVAVVAALIPLAPGGALVPPDLLFCLILAWTLRAPRPVPVWVLVLMGLFADALMSRPLGLGALGLLLAAEAMRGLRPRLRGVPFAVEWLAAAILFALVLAAMHLALRLVFAEAPPAVDLLRYLVATAIAYPLMAAVVAVGLRQRRSARERAA